ncbi:hypothetical protein [Nocardia sp. NPDC051570]|uniref:hypothetical protein n=1 Tax=Nocardia sp. NPDC051570 TaxID=3364324 RepID=UPI00378C8DB3
MGVPETGQQGARDLYRAATRSEGSVFEIAEDVARNLAAACDRLVDDLQRAHGAELRVADLTGFPNLPSGRALTRGFAGKSREFLDTITAYQQTALLFKAAYLAAGKRFDDAEAANRAAVELLAVRSGDHL